MKPNAKYNLVAEYKNEKNSKKADGAILKDDIAIGVIELKGTNTKDLEKVRQQAFDYKANQTGCVYVITSNFEKLRFYINNAVDFEEFNLFNLSQERFELLYLCVSKENLLNNIPLKIKDSSIQEEEAITKKFYSDYSIFKRELYRDLVKQNMKNEVFRSVLDNNDNDRAVKNIKRELFKKSQKLIDRFLFIFFAEDRGLLPPNSTLKILAQWDKLNDMDAYAPLYERYKKYFNYLDTGRKGTDKVAEIFAYNGGLFKPDKVLDSLLIGDELLYKHTKALSNYDFESQVDVNILGHIFENSLNEIESVNAEIEGGEFDKQKTKRKKDGVFYTPKYITKYIVDNTVGKLCIEKKQEFSIIDEEYLKDRKGRTKAKLKQLLDNLEAYREWLLQITILDPACGSGAFLNQALDFLINEHEYIDELQTSLLGGGFVFPDIENTVLENNIYGVDLNEESVEIAKLSLWLRTAQPRRKLNSLSNNIKCGNSLIESKAVAGDKAFKWEEEYKHVFEKGGFDVVIGNPPYGVSFNEKEKEYLTKFDSLVPDYEIYIYFISLYKTLLKEKGLLSYIFPNTFLSTLYGIKYREYIFNEVSVDEIVDLSNDNTFVDASVRTIIFTFSNFKSNYTSRFTKINGSEFEVFQKYFKHEILDESTNMSSLFYQTIEEKSIINKLNKNNKIIDFFQVSQGYIPYRRSDLVKNYGEEKGNSIVNNREWHSNEKETDEWQQEILGKDVKRYFHRGANSYFKYGKHVASYVDFKFFSSRRILVREITSDYLFCDLIENNYVNNPSLINIINEKNVIPLELLLGILNSKLIGWFHKKNSPKANKGLFPKILINDVRNIPIPTIKNNIIDILIIKINHIKSFINSLYNCSDKFTTYLQSQFQIEKLSKKLQNWNELEFGEFIKELNKAIKKENKERVKNELEPIQVLSKLDEMDWMEVFETKKAEANKIKAEIDKTDAAIDQMVYELYELTEEEIEIVENS